MYAPSPPPVATAMAGNQAGSGSNANHHFRLTFPAEHDLRTGIGYSWQMCGDAYVRPPALDLDYGTPLSQRSLVVRLVAFDLVRGLAAGEPVGDCAEIGESEVFARRWSKANVSLDCRSFTASVDML